MSKKLFFVIYLLSFFGLIEATSDDLPKTLSHQERLHPIEGSWTITKNGNGNSSWFAIEIVEDKINKGQFGGYLIDEGSLSVKKGSKILDFHEVGSEFWGTICYWSSPSPCKVLTHEESQKIIIELSSCSFSGKKIQSKNSFKTDSPKYVTLDRTENPSATPQTSSQTNNSSLNTKSYNSISYTPTPVGDYGEISKETGRPKTVHVNGYTRKDGTFVKPHYRSAPRRK